MTMGVNIHVITRSRLASIFVFNLFSEGKCVRSVSLSPLAINLSFTKDFPLIVLTLLFEHRLAGFATF